ncbi:hypothetical protein JOB18_042058 [Solea senegalensis]|uniref:Uncharacterized protein n=1 Tax=Solea senegalensis TaxID=28829 RepID=A0AAV6PH96_SOLSE|nr:hypothetical protein JOB18_042058 [Solea senegalensis]
MTKRLLVTCFPCGMSMVVRKVCSIVELDSNVTTKCNMMKPYKARDPKVGRYPKQSEERASTSRKALGDIKTGYMKILTLNTLSPCHTHLETLRGRGPGPREDVDPERTWRT